METASGRPPVQWPFDRFPQRQGLLRGMFDSHADELRPGFNREAGSFFIPRMVGSALDAAIAFRPDAFANGELEQELDTMLSYYLIGERQKRELACAVLAALCYRTSYRTPTSNE